MERREESKAQLDIRASKPKNRSKGRKFTIKVTLAQAVRIVERMLLRDIRRKAWQRGGRPLSQRQVARQLSISQTTFHSIVKHAFRGKGWKAYLDAFIRDGLVPKGARRRGRNGVSEIEAIDRTR